IVRVVSFLEGTTEWNGATPLQLSAAIGTTLARLQRALRGFFHPAGGRTILWDARSAGALLDWVEAITDPEMRQAVASILKSFPERVLPRLAGLPAQPIHNDFHRGNLLIDPEREEVSGIIDFGDLVHGTRSQDLAVACSYAMLETPDLLEVIRPLISAFSDVTPLLGEEVEVIGDLIGVRLAQSIVIGSWRAVRHPANADYILLDAASVAEGLERWLDLGEEKIQDAIRTAAGMAVAPAGSGRLQHRRAHVLPPGFELTYAEPLHLVGGDGVWLIDAAGRRYLDAYNNVVQVGHANRRVNRAVADQMGRLNTNTRYLTDASN
ncbi:MAG: phosphotransferase, partial [Acidimicrobiia bacterium]|nr:phosphotransferase [Acidimicrobiia bacterium]